MPPRPNHARRIHILGGPGSGKTTVARDLGRRLELPVHELDLVGYEDGVGARRPFEERLADVRTIAAQPEWVTEGAFLGWTDELLRAADVIIRLDVRWRVAAWRLVTRHVRANLAGTNRHPGTLRLLRFLRFARRYYSDSEVIAVVPDNDGNNSRASTSRHLEQFASKVVRCGTASDVDAFVSDLPSP